MVSDTYCIYILMLLIIDEFDRLIDLLEFNYWFHLTQMSILYIENI